MTVAKASTPYGRGNRANTKPAPPPLASATGDRVVFADWGAINTQQEQVLAHDAGIDLVIAGLGGGKSRVGAYKLVRWALANPRRPNGEPTSWLVLGKDFRMAKKTQFKLILGVIRSLGVPESLIVKQVRYGQEPEITLWSGVTFMAFSGTDADATRSHEFDGVWADEAEYMDVQSFMTALSRLRNAERIRAIVTSSPDGSGWIYPLINGEYPDFNAIREKTELRVFRWRSKDNPTNKAEVLEALEAGMNAVRRGLALQELGGRFLGTSEAPGSGAIEYVRAFSGRVEIVEEDDTKARAIGVDLGKSEDFTWTTAINSKGVVLAMDRYNLSELDVTPEDYWPYVARRLIQFAEKLVGQDQLTIVIDSARGGDHFAATLRGLLQELDLTWQVVEYPTDVSGKKAELVETLGMGMSMGRFLVPTAWTHAGSETIVEHVERLRLELKKLKTTQLPGGKRRFDHPLGGHDDGVVSGGLAYHGLGLEPPRRISGFPAWD